LLACLPQLLYHFDLIRTRVFFWRRRRRRRIIDDTAGWHWLVSAYTGFEKAD
jgi:hypothetical protein